MKCFIPTCLPRRLSVYAPTAGEMVVGHTHIKRCMRLSVHHPPDWFTAGHLIQDHPSMNDDPHVATKHSGSGWVRRGGGGSYKIGGR